MIKILDAGISAPSSKNTQPWFLLADTTDKKNEIADIIEAHPDPSNFFPKYHTSVTIPCDRTYIRSAQLLRDAPAVIHVFSDSPFVGGFRNVIRNPDPRLIRSYCLEISGLAACVQNMLIAAKMLNLGALWNNDPIGIAPEVERIYGVHRDYFTSVCIGYPDELEVRNKPKKRKKKYKII